MFFSIDSVHSKGESTMKKSLITVCLGVFLAILSSNASAQIVPEKFSITPVIGGYSFYHETYFRDNPVVGLRAGYDITERWGVEGAFDYVPTTLKNGGGGVNVFGYRLDALFHFMPQNKLVPYLAAGVGGTTSDKSAGSRSNETDFLVNYGGGLKYFLTEALALRADVRNLWVFDGGRNDWEYTVGLTYLFGGPKAKAAPAVADSDNDGVPDDQDRCPGTPSGVAVDRYGCPLDSDRDGVPDYLDKCPDTPRGTVVDKNGCPVQEKAPAAKAPEKISVALEIEFDTAKADIKPKYHDKIKKVADFMTTYPETKAVIEGHTDNVGSDASNRTLSTRRSESVKKYLIEKFGIAPERLTAKGYGPSKPIADNATAEGRQKNRRINAVIETVTR